ncbi:LysR family transcriptional regulator [Marinibactrum halimedae]|uniref:LysR family transcriptional regulator n=1 Tax=Marinibactrum halimedae TaxID=1444977 RepID=A0AA37WLX9_9GAMM|nr:LysR family transcriptional regulator [Marinibactrum halimedae]MCD9458564.1 LysR family transcriptional regulator [Marinibactrum halimedae]GLS26569.1 LysR family transcriptional regulator [Marinibactrum halimedae]
MQIDRVDLNLLVYLDTLLREKNVTKAATILGISQPAMSNGLRRLRDLFNDPILVRTSDGMTPTERALELQPVIRRSLSELERAIQPRADFDPESSHRVFRIMASDYAESTLLPEVLLKMRDLAPNVTLDVMTPSDVSFHDLEQGKVDLAVNRFDSLPQSFHHIPVWRDRFLCMVNADNPIRNHFDLEVYLEAKHVWVSKTGMGIGVGVNPDDVQRLGWVDEALNKIDKKRNISVFTRHYQAAMLLAETLDLIVTLPSKAARLHENNPKVALLEPPFEIPPLELTLAWSPLLQHNPEHRWIRRLLMDVARGMDDYSVL